MSGALSANTLRYTLYDAQEAKIKEGTLYHQLIRSGETIKCDINLWDFGDTAKKTKKVVIRAKEDTDPNSGAKFDVIVQYTKYSDILLTPEKYVGQKITIEGKFQICNTENRSFNLEQGDHHINMFYEKLSKDDQAHILEVKQSSDNSVTVKGTVQLYSNAKNTYYLMASSISW